jgi:hypothetical protein
LADHLPTRVYLMNRVLDARKHLGLPDAPRVELPTQEDEESPQRHEEHEEDKE